MFATSTHALIHTPIHFLREITTSNAIDMGQQNNLRCMLQQLSM